MSGTFHPASSSGSPILTGRSRVSDAARSNGLSGNATGRSGADVARPSRRPSPGRRPKCVSAGEPTTNSVLNTDSGMTFRDECRDEIADLDVGWMLIAHDHLRGSPSKGLSRRTTASASTGRRGRLRVARRTPSQSPAPAVAQLEKGGRLGAIDQQRGGRVHPAQQIDRGGTTIGRVLIHRPAAGGTV